MAKKGESVLVGVVALVLVYLALPTLGAMVGGALDEATTVLLAVAPKVAVVAGLAALIMLCIPFTRHHAQGMLFAAILLAVSAAGFSTAVAWLGGHSAVLTADVLNAGNALLARVNGSGGRAMASRKEKASGRGRVLAVLGAGGLVVVGELLAAVGAIAHPLVVVIPAVIVLGLALWLVWRAMVPSRATRVVTRILQLEDERPQLRRVRKRRSVWQLAWKMPVGATVADLRARLDALEEGLDCSASCWYDRGLVWVELGTHRLPELVEFGRFCEQSPAEVEGMGLPIPLGESKVGRLWADLEALPHLLVGGTTRYAAARLRVVLVDLKGGMEFNAFQDLPHLLYPVVSELEDCEIAFGLVGQEMDRRQRIFAAAGVESLGEWNATHQGRELPWPVLVVDEFGGAPRGADDPCGMRGPPPAVAAVGRS